MFRTSFALVLALSVLTETTASEPLLEVRASEPAADSPLRDQGGPCETDDCAIITIKILTDQITPASATFDIEIIREYFADDSTYKTGYPNYNEGEGYVFSIPGDELAFNNDDEAQALVSGNFRAIDSQGGQKNIIRFDANDPIKVTVKVNGNGALSTYLAVQPAAVYFLSQAKNCIANPASCFWGGKTYDDILQEHAQLGTFVEASSNVKNQDTKYLAWQVSAAAYKRYSTDVNSTKLEFCNDFLSDGKDGSCAKPYNFDIPKEAFPEWEEVGDPESFTRYNFAVAIEGFEGFDPPGTPIAITTVTVKFEYVSDEMNSFEGTQFSLLSDGNTDSASLQDPHLSLADGGVADFRGSHNDIYNMLSSRSISVNALFREQDFFLASNKEIEFVESGAVQGDRTLVHGTFMFELYTTIRTSSGRLLHLRSVANPSGSANLAFIENGVPVSAMGTGEKSVIDDVTIELEGTSATISTPSWKVSCVSVNTEKSHFMNLKLSQRVPESVAPHGVIGQSYDGDGIAVDGKQDMYSDMPGAETTTSAQAEGAVEGVYTDYIVDAPFATDYKFSRFDRKSAAARNVEALSGSKANKRDRRKLEYMLRRLVGADNIAAAN